MEKQNKGVTDAKTLEMIQEHYNGIILPEIGEKMYQIPMYINTGLDINEATEGETIEEKIERIVNNGEPIKDGAPIIYTDRAKGVEPQYNIRTDRWEIAVQAMDTVSRAQLARREEQGGTIDINRGKEPGGNQEPIQGSTT